MKVSRIGKLYKPTMCFWFFYPSQQAAFSANIPYNHIEVSARRCANYWSQELGCKINLIPPQSIFVLLELDHVSYLRKVLTEAGEIGWIHVPSWTIDGIQEVNQ
jgi:hypothetical protein